MKGKKCFTLFGILSGVFVALLSATLWVNPVNAQSINNFASIQYYYRNSTSGSYQLATKNNAGPYFQIWNPTTTGYGSIYRLNASAILPNSLKGSSFSGTGDIYWEITHDTGIDGGFHCPSVVEITVRPEQGTITSEQSQVSSCSLVYQDQATDRYKISVQSAGNLSASTTITSFYIRMIGTESKPIFDFVGVPNQSYVSVSLSANINFTMSTDPNTAVFGEINQNITNIYNQQQQQAEQDQQDRENISNTSEEGEEAGEEAGDAAANKGQTLLQAFGTLIAALGQVHETNCKLPNMQVYSLQLNNIDMCAVSLPNGVSALLGVGICILIVLLGIKLVKRMLALYKEITG